jgi:PIN like domain
MSSRRSSGSPSTTSEPPSASSWAAPPELYLDENIAGRTIAGGLRDLGYLVHTPAELYGSREAAEGVRDEVWLADVGRHGWTVISRDTKILQRRAELAAYKAAKLHMFLYPGQATREALLEALRATLSDVCTMSSRATPGVWRVHSQHGRWTVTQL